MRFSQLITVIVSLTQLFWKSSLLFIYEKYYLCSFFVNVIIQKHTKYDLFVCGDTLSLMACGYSLRRLFMNYNEPTHPEYVLAGSDYKHFFSFCFLMSWTFFPFTTHQFGESSLVITLWCCFAVPFLFRVFSSMFASSSSSMLFLPFSFS